MDDKNTEERLTAGQAAELMQISRITLYSWASKGKGPAKYVFNDSVIYYVKSEVEDWIEANTVRVNPEAQEAR